jgi:hypothetical protein
MIGDEWGRAIFKMIAVPGYLENKFFILQELFALNILSSSS